MGDIGNADAQVLAVCKDSAERNANVAGKLKLGFPILSDPDLQVTQAYGLLHKNAGTPSGNSDLARPGVFILDRKGVVSWRHLTDNWRIRVRPETVVKQLAKIP